jgi:EmrB/QacA subfamily drug resistance transporter
VFFTLASLAVLMSAIDSTIVAIAIPQLTDAFQAPLTWVGWTLTGYQLVQIIMLPLAGRLSDTLGRKRVFLACTAAFTLGSLLCGLAPSIGFLISFRALQALGGGGLMPSAIGIISDQFGNRRAQARGLFSSVFPIGGIIGPNLGGFIVHNWSWRELFFVNVPLGAVVLLGVSVLLRENRAARPQLRVDLPGIGLFTGAVAVLMYGMTALGNDAALVSSPALWGLFGLSAALLVLFLRHVQRAAEPLVRYDLLVRNPFLAANLYNFVYGAVAFGFSSFVPYYAVLQYGMSPFESGAVLTPRAVANIGATVLASLYIIRLGYRLPMISGALLISLSLALMGQGWMSVQVGPLALSGFWLLAMIIMISGIGVGLGGPAANNASLDLAPRELAALTGLRGMFRQTGGAVGTAAVVLALSFFTDKAYGLGVIFVTLAGVLLLTVPLAFMIPDMARERILAQSQLADGAVPAPAEALAVPVTPGGVPE